MEKTSPKYNNFELAKEIEDYLLQTRRDLHQIPELGFEETKTIRYLKDQIQQIISKSSLSFSFTEKKGGLVVSLTVDKDAKRFLLRADIDALPIEEDVDVDFASRHKGKMHACGHDMHMTMLLGALKIIAEVKVKPKVNLTFIWQRSEEKKVDGISGAEMLVSEGVMNSIDMAFALHVYPFGETGKIETQPGVTMANTAQIHIWIKCTGGHVLSPHMGTNAIDILQEIQFATKDFLQRNLDPHEASILVPSIIEAGNVSNVRPGTGYCCFSFRNYLEKDVAIDLMRKYRKFVEGIVNQYDDASIEEYRYFDGYPKVVNSPEAVEYVQASLGENFSVVKGNPSFGGEDFAYYAEKVPACFSWMGVRGESCTNLHSATFNPDESALAYGVAYWLSLAI